ncbi:hypothetical protein ACP4OV_000071 [Aristida adscensionis]
MERKPEEPLHGALVQSKEVPGELQLWDLPMNVLCDIISRLALRDAIRTSVLSREWRHVWRDHTNLTFNRYSLRRYRDKTRTRVGFQFPIAEHDFIARADAVLQQHSGTGIDRMEVMFTLHNKNADHVDRWVEFAVTSKAKELVLRLSEITRNFLYRNMRYALPADRVEPYSFPCHLFHGRNGSYLRRLHLFSVSVNVPGDFNGFGSLKKLSMVDVDITEEHVEHLLSTCNVLEFLEIAYCRKLTSLRIHPLSQLKHLQVENCVFLKQIEMNCGLSTLEYSGPSVPLKFATTSGLRSVCVKLLTNDIAVDYITTGFPSTLPHLETLSLQIAGRERATLPVRLVKFTHLRHLELELIIFENGNKERNIDILDYACLLDAAPFLETLWLDMWMLCDHQPYRPEHGELRTLTSPQHAHLRSVYISGFFGRKDQVELALHILRSSAGLEKMEIDPSVRIEPACGSSISIDRYLDGCKVAMKCIAGADHKNVVEVVGSSELDSPELDVTQNDSSHASLVIQPRGCVKFGRM